MSHTPSTTPWLSLLLPMYNVQDYLPACLDSIFSQYQDGIEVLLLDDCSTDNSLAIARDYAARYPQLQMLQHAQNGGLSKARNSLMASARGNYVWFVDSDDVLLPGAIAHIKPILNQANPPDLLLFDFKTMHEKRSLKRRLKDLQRIPSFIGRYRCTGDDSNTLAFNLMHAGQLHSWSKIGTRAVWQQIHFPEGRSFEDIATLGQLVSAVTRWQYLPRACIGYRVRANSITTSQSAKNTGDLFLALVDLKRQMQPRTLQFPPLTRALDRFCLHRLSTIARWQAQTGKTLPVDAALLLDAMYPHGVAQAIEQATSLGWYKRARQVRRRFKRVGWLP